MKTKNTAETIIEIKKTIHRLSVENVNALTKKEFDLLREIESKLNEFLATE